MIGDAERGHMASVLRLAAAVGLNLDPVDIVIEERDDRLLARLAGGLMVWLPLSPAAMVRLDHDRLALAVLARRCSFRIPQVLHVDGAGGDIRRSVVGAVDPWGMAELVKADGKMASRVGSQLGEILADQHGNVAESDVRPWVKDRVSWPEPAEWIAPRLSRVTADRLLLDRMERMVDRYFGAPVAEGARVFVHGDFGLHNIAFLEPGVVGGIFDYDGAAWDDFHHDFKYLEFERGNSIVLDAAIAAYTTRTGRDVDRRRIDLLNAVSAICFLANRDGVAPDVRWCGRTLEEDLRWVADALSRVD